tara:strand:+ start:252 stop:449 length:198 start_codon:yes stop_codon:yes gene_type:complete
MKKKIKSNDIFKKIEKLRSKNNKNWMDILRLAYMSNPKKTSVILNKILSKDKELIKLANKLKVNK